MHCEKKIQPETSLLTPFVQNIHRSSVVDYFAEETNEKNCPPQILLHFPFGMSIECLCPPRKTSWGEGVGLN